MTDLYLWYVIHCKLVLICIIMERSKIVPHFAVLPNDCCTMSAWGTHTRLSFNKQRTVFNDTQQSLDHFITCILHLLKTKVAIFCITSACTRRSNGTTGISPRSRRVGHDTSDSVAIFLQRAWTCRFKALWSGRGWGWITDQFNTSKVFKECDGLVCLGYLPGNRELVSAH